MLVTLRWQRVKLVNTENIELIALFLQLKTFFTVKNLQIPVSVGQSSLSHPTTACGAY